RFAALATPAPDGDQLGPPCGVVIIGDDRDMARAATRRLMDRGHRRIAFIAESLRPQRSHDRWFEGFCMAHLAADRPIDRSLVGVIGLDHAGLVDMVERFAASGAPPTAAVVTDLAAVNPLLRELHAHAIDIHRQDMIVWGS